MVVDEELKMMSAVCSDGGRITGPHLKEMSRLTHTEYVLRGRSRLDPRDILRETMFAPTVTGSPMQNACTVITRHERTPRGYYSGVAALFTPPHGRDPARRVHARPRRTDPHPHRVPRRRAAAGAGRRHARAPLRSVRRGQRDARQGRGRARRDRGDPAGHGGIAAADLALPADAIDEDAPTAEPRPLADDPDIAALLASRNARLASFWLNPQDALGQAGPFARALARSWSTPRTGSRRCSPTSCATSGSTVTIVPWNEVTDDADRRPPSSSCRAPVPATRATRGTPRMRRMREVVARRRASGRPLLAVCLSHQILADSLGIELAPLDAPAPGTAEDRRRVRDAGVDRLLQHVHRARPGRHDRASARPRSLPTRSPAMSTRCAAPASRRCRATSSRSCRATA